MKLFIFGPDHRHWKYVGGALIIAAENFEQCKKIVFEKYYNPNYPWERWPQVFQTEQEIDGYLLDEENSEYHLWMLKVELECVVSDAGIIFYDCYID